MRRRLTDWIYVRRWQLARAIAPVPIMADMLDGEDGAFVIQRADRHEFRFRLAAYKVRSLGLRTPRDSKTFADYMPPRRYFVGRVGR